MKLLSQTDRRGAALLLVLFGLLTTTALLVPAASWALSITGSTRALAEQESAIAVARALEPVLLDWLDTRAPSVVLPPDAPVPGALVLEERFDGSPELWMRVLAFDQAGMVAAGAVQSGSPLALLLSTEHRAHALWLTDLGQPIALGTTGLIDLALGAQGGLFPADVHDAQAFGARVATHLDRGGALCPWTAPLAILEQAFTLLGRGDLSAVLGARATGKRIDLAFDAFEPESALVPRLVSQSPVWSFRIDVRVGRTHQAWWATYKHGAGGWQVVQRVFIDE